MNKKRLILVMCLIVAIFGLFLSSMLTLAKYNDSIAAICGEDLDNSCNTVQNSEFSKLVLLEDEIDDVEIFSIPISFMGVIFYLMFIGVSIYGLFFYKQNKFSNKFNYFLIGLAGVGVAFSIIFTIIQAFFIEAFCTFCVLSAFDTLILLILSFLFIFQN